MVPVWVTSVHSSMKTKSKLVVQWKVFFVVTSLNPDKYRYSSS